MNFYVTFGQRYRSEPHPSGIMVDPDAVIKIEAESKEEAHAKAMDIFKGAFHQVLNEEGWENNKSYFPHGSITLVLVEGHDGSKVRPSYIGDSVYLEPDSRGIGIVLTTRNGLPTDPSNTIFLDWSVYRRLKEEVKQMTGGKL